MAKSDEILAHYSAALDEIYRLRTLLAWEAEVLAMHLTYSTFPKSRRALADTQVRRMRMAASGLGQAVYATLAPAQESVRHVRRLAGMSPTLTRREWEATRPRRARVSVSVR